MLFPSNGRPNLVLRYGQKHAKTNPGAYACHFEELRGSNGLFRLELLGTAWKQSDCGWISSREQDGDDLRHAMMNGVEHNGGTATTWYKHSGFEAVYGGFEMTFA